MRKVEFTMNEEKTYTVIKKLAETNGNKKRAAVELGCTIRTFEWGREAECIKKDCKFKKFGFNRKQVDPFSYFWYNLNSGSNSRCLLKVYL